MNEAVPESFHTSDATISWMNDNDNERSKDTKYLMGNVLVYRNNGFDFNDTDNKGLEMQYIPSLNLLGSSESFYSFRRCCICWFSIGC